MELLDVDEVSNTRKTARTIDDVIANGYKFNFGDYFGRTFQLFGKTWAFLLGHSGIFVATYIIVYVLMAILIFSSMSGLMSNVGREPLDNTEMLQNMGPVFNMMLIAFAIILVWVVAFAMPFRAGIYTFLHNSSGGQKHVFGDFFQPFRTKWVKLMMLIILWVITSFIFVGAAYFNWAKHMPALMQKISEDPEAFNRNPFVMYQGMGWIWLAYIPTLFFQVALSLAIPLLLFQTDSIGKAFVGSLKIVTRKWIQFFALYLIIYILSFVGFLACGIGILLTMQFFPLCIYAIYEDIFIKQNQTT